MTILECVVCAAVRLCCVKKEKCYYLLITNMNVMDTIKQSVADQIVNESTT